MKILKINSCDDCFITHKHKVYLNCPEIGILRDKVLRTKVHSDCPLEDYESTCECEPFQSCEKCSDKTEWRPVSEMEQPYKEYWLLDRNNNVGSGFLVHKNKININVERMGGVVDNPVMFAEIKPPKIKG